MESHSIEFRQPQLEESFSFSSCHNFNSSSSFVFFSDDDDVDCPDDESYIEIALEPAHINKDDEMEVRISFSSSIPLSAAVKSAEFMYDHSPVSCKSSSSLSSSSSSAFTFSSSFTESQRNLEVNQSKQACDYVRPDKTFKSKVQFPLVNRFVSTFISSFRLSPEIKVRDVRSLDTDHLEIVPSNSERNPSNVTTTRINSNTSLMMNFLVKFRTLKLKTLLASFLKASQTNSGGYGNGKKPEENFRMYKYANLVDKKGTAAERKLSNGERSRTLELNLDAIKGYMLEAMRISSRRDRRTKSCPVSTKSSPIHHRSLSESYKISAADNSIQAAIAHCKESFATNI